MGLPLPKQTAAAPRRLVLLPHQEIEYRAFRLYDLILAIGGIGSGKTTSLVLWLLDRMQWDTGQVHALFALTTVQVRAIQRLLYKQFNRLGIRHVFNKRPPAEWVQDWERRGIKTPPAQDRYENIVIFENGLHLQLGTLNAYEQHRGAEWGSLAVEEFGLRRVSRDAIDFLFERTRCGDSDSDTGFDCAVELGHRHTKILHSNPPEAADHWSWSLLETLAKEAKRVAKERGVDVGDDDGSGGSDEEDYRFLIRGYGSAILIPSRTQDNTHLQKRYITDQLIRLDKDTAARRLGGSLSRKRSGLAYRYFSRENERPVGYHEERPLYVALDFNNRPVAATLLHELQPGEYPKEHEHGGVTHVGQFGEVFDTDGGGLQALCDLLLEGDVGNRGAAPSNWHGLLEHKGPVVFFGDSTGLNQQASGQSLWEMVDDVIGTRLEAAGIAYSRNVPRNPVVPLRVRAVNAKCISAADIRSYWIDPRCVNTIRDFLTIVWDKIKQDVQKYGERGGSENHLLTHLSDSVGYLMSALFPLGHEIDPGAGGVRIIRKRRRQREVQSHM